MLDPRLVEAVARNFGINPGEVSPETNADTLTAWDSVGHLKLILDLEESFAVRFPAPEIPGLTSIGRIQQALDRLGAR
jgi:acyl carrier protein